MSAWQTRRVYDAEEEILSRYLNRRLKMPVLKSLASWIAFNSGAEVVRAGRFPVVVAGRGLKDPGGYSSYCETWPKRMRRAPRIVLARHQRTRKYLIHELAHALGPFGEELHGRAFMRRYLDMLAVFGRVDRMYVELVMLSHGVKI